MARTNSTMRPLTLTAPQFALPFALLWALLAAIAPGNAAALELKLEVRTDARFSRPHDVVLSPDGRYLYVSDLGNDAVPVLDAQTLRTVGMIGKDELSSPHDVTFDAAGRLLVADTGHDRVAIYALEGTGGKLVGELKGGLSNPEGVVVDARGRVVVTSAGGHTLTVFENGRPVRTVGGRGSGNGEYARPHDIDVDAQGRFFVVDPGNNRIQILDGELNVVRTLGGPGFDFNDPKYLAFDAAGRLYVADEYNNALKVFDADYRLVATFIQLGGHDLNKPEGVTVRGDTVWLADTYNDRILRLTLLP